MSGRVPMMPRYVLGNWWSRYWEYRQDELARPDAGVSREAGAAVRLHHRHGLAHHRDRQRIVGLDRLHLEPGALARPRGLHRLAARAGAADCAQPAPGRWRLAARGAVRGDGAVRWGRTRRSREPVHFDLADPQLRRRLLRTSCTTRWRPRASISGGWTGSRASAWFTRRSLCRGDGPAVVAEPPALLRPGPGRHEAALHLLALGRPGQPALPHRLLGR